MAAPGTLERPALAVPFDLILAAKPAEETSDGKRFVEGFAATSDLDLQGDVIQPEALDKAAAGAIGLTVLLNHDENQIIGKVVDARAIREGSEGQLWVKVEIDKGEDKVWSKIQQGMLNKFSIRGMVTKAHRRFDRSQNQQVNVVEELQLLEISLVAVPANPKALAIRAYVAKGLTEFVKSGGLIPVEGKTQKETGMSVTLYAEWAAYCAEKGFDPFVAEIGEGMDEAAVLKAAGEKAVELWVEFCKAKETPYPVPYPYQAPLMKQNGDATKLVDEAMVALEMETPDVSAALSALTKAKTALAMPAEPAKAEGGEKPAADAPAKDAGDDAAAAKTVEPAPATVAAPVVTPVAPVPATVAPVTVEAMKEALDALRKDYEDLATTVKATKLAAEVVKEADGLTYTQEEVDAICRSALRRAGVMKEGE